MSKLIGKRVVVLDRPCTPRVGQVGTIVEVNEKSTFGFPIKVCFYGSDTRPGYYPDELRYLNNKEVKL